MADTPADRRYTDDHEWARVDDDDATVVWVGITDYAQEQLGDIVMVELPEVDDEIALKAPFGTVESPKSVSDLFAPVGGTVIAVNEVLEDEPELVNTSPYADGWIVKLRLSDAADLEALMDAAAYDAHLAGLDAD